MFVRLVFVDSQFLNELNESECPSPEDILMLLEAVQQDDPSITLDDLLAIGVINHEY
jgi:hypothetical protein